MRALPPFSTGVHDTVSIHVGGLPHNFWSLRERKLHYPLGWDLFLMSQHYVIGVPRTARVEMEVL